MGLEWKFEEQEASETSTYYMQYTPKQQKFPEFKCDFVNRISRFTFFDSL